MTYPIKQLEGLRATAPQYFNFDVGDLDEIAAGTNLEQHRLSLYDGTFLGDVLPKLDWWLALGEFMSFEASEQSASVAGSDLAAFRSRFVGMASGVLCRYATALALNPSVAGLDVDGTDVALDLLAHYRQLTCLVRDFARKLWPGINLGWLWAEA